MRRSSTGWKGRLISEPLSVWSILGIAPTRDADVIRRAYAARLKQAKSDPQAFIQLRQAYDAALKGGDSAKQARTGKTEARVVPADGMLTAREFGDGLAAAIVSPDPQGLDRFLSNRLLPDLPLQLSSAYEAEAIRRIDAISIIPLEHLQSLQTAFGWGDMTHALSRTETQAYLSFLKRVNTGLLRQTLQDDAATLGWSKPRANRRIAARLVLGRGRPYLIDIYDEAIVSRAKAHADAIKADRPWSDALYDRNRIDWLSTRRKDPRRNITLIAFTASVTAMLLYYLI